MNRASNFNGKASSGSYHSSAQTSGNKQEKKAQLSKDQISVRNFTQKLNALANKGNVEACESLMLDLIRANLKPTSVTVNVLLKVYCHHTPSQRGWLHPGNYRPLAILEAMEGNFIQPFVEYSVDSFTRILQACAVVPPDEGSYNVIITALSRAKRYPDALGLIYRQKMHGFSCSKSLSAFLRVLPADYIEGISKMLLGETDDNFHMGFSFNLNDFEVDISIANTIFKVLLEHEDDSALALALRLKNYFETAGLVSDGRTYSIFLSYCASKPDATESEILFLDCLQNGIKPDLILMTSYVNCLVSRKNPSIEEAEAIVDLMEHFSMKPINPMLNLPAVVSYCRTLRTLHDIWAIFGSPKPDIMLYNLLVKGCTRVSPPAYVKARKTLDHCIAIGLKPSIVTISSVVNAYCSVGLPKEAEDFVNSLLSTDATGSIKKNATLYNTLIKGYARCRCQIRVGKCSCVVCSCSNPDEALRLVNVMENLGLAPDEITLNTLIDSLTSAKRFSQAKMVIDSVMWPENSKIKPTLNTYNIFLRGILRYLTRREANQSADNQRVVMGENHHISDLVKAAQNDMCQRGIKFDDVTRSSLIKAYGYIMKDSELLDLIQDSILLGDKDTHRNYSANHLILAWCRKNKSSFVSPESLHYFSQYLRKMKLLSIILDVDSVKSLEELNILDNPDVHEEFAQMKVGRVMEKHEAADLSSCCGHSHH